MVKLDEMIHEPVCMLKIDVQGFEPRVIEGATKLIKEQGVQHMLVEVWPAGFADIYC
jgi:FkbM family methyltransferase